MTDRPTKKILTLKRFFLKQRPPLSVSGLSGGGSINCYHQIRKGREEKRVERPDGRKAVRGMGVKMEGKEDRKEGRKERWK